MIRRFGRCKVTTTQSRVHERTNRAGPANIPPAVLQAGAALAGGSAIGGLGGAGALAQQAGATPPISRPTFPNG